LSRTYRLDGVRKHAQNFVFLRSIVDQNRHWYIIEFVPRKDCREAEPIISAQVILLRQREKRSLARQISARKRRCWSRRRQKAWCKLGCDKESRFEAPQLSSSYLSSPLFTNFQQRRRIQQAQLGSTTSFVLLTTGTFLFFRPEIASHSNKRQATPRLATRNLKPQGPL
jgi:hypothetical protein